MGSPPIARRRATLRRRPGVASGRGTLFQAGADLTTQAASAVGESLEKRREHKSLPREQLAWQASLNCNNY